MALEEILHRLGDRKGLQADISNTKSSLGQSSAGHEEAQKCNHFTIRGYVAEVRKKNSVEMSWPFELPDKNGGFEEELSDVLPPMEIPTFRYWACNGCTQTGHPSANPVPSLVLEMIPFEREGDTNDCEDCVAIDNQMRELALATVTGGVQDLEMLSIERIDAGEGENFQVVDSDKRGTKPLPNNGQVLEITYSRRNDAEMECENPMVDSDRMETADVTMSGSTRVMETKSSGRKDAWNECENHSMVDTDTSETAPLAISNHGRDVINSQKCKSRPSESTEDQVSVDESQDSSHKKTPRFRRVSEMIKVKKTGASSIKDPETTAQDNHNSPALGYHSLAQNGTEKMSKKRKVLHDEPQTSPPKKCSKSLGKSRFYFRDREESKIGDSSGVYSNDKNRFPENGKQLKVSSNDIKEVEVDKRQKRGSKSKRDHLEKHIKSAKPRTTFPLPVEASPTRHQDVTVDDQDIEAEIVAFLTKRQQERLSKEASSAGQINPVAPQEIGKLTRPNIVSAMPRENTKEQIVSPSMGFQGGNHISEESYKENCLGEGRERLSEYTSAGMYGKIRNSKMPETYSTNYMPATELLQLMISGMCPRVPSPVVPRLENSATLRIEESEKVASEAPILSKTGEAVALQFLSTPGNQKIGNHVPISGTLVALELGTSSSELCPGRTASGEPKLGKEGRCTISGVSITESAPSKLGSPSSKPCSSNGPRVRRRVGGKTAVQYTNVIPKIEVCGTNKNPADYTVPGPRNRFMIGHKDLKRETTEAPKRGRPRKVVSEAPKPNENGP